MVQHRSVEHLHGGTSGVGESHHLLGPAAVGLLRRQPLDADVGCLQGPHDRTQRRAVSHLPAHGDDLIRLARHHHDARGTLVHPQIQGVGIGPAAFGETQHTQREMSPAVHVPGRNGQVSQARQHQIIDLSGPCGSIPNELSADAWNTVLGT